jgi:hypothetical protein
VTVSDHLLSVNDHLVASDVVDDEAVIINLDNGMYFTMDKVGAELWQLLAQPRSLAAMASILAGRYGIAESEVLRDVEEVVDELLREQLVVAGHDAERGTHDERASTGAARQPSYSKPVLMKYTDMSDVLALDPPLPQLGADFPRGS